MLAAESRKRYFPESFIFMNFLIHSVKRLFAGNIISIVQGFAQ